MAIDRATLAGVECLDTLARTSADDPQVEWTLLAYDAPLSELCLEPGCLPLVPDSPSARPLPGPARARLGRLSGGEVSPWAETSTAALPGFVAGARVTRCPRPPSPCEEIRSGSVHTCALLVDGSVWCWGDNGFGQLGDGTTTSRVNPTRVGLDDVSQLELGDFTTCAVSRGTVFCWGRNDSGQLGRPGPSSPWPTPVHDVDFRAALAVGKGHACAAANIPGTEAKKVMCWGRNESGELGTGNTDPQTGPVETASITGVRKLAVGGQRSCAIVGSENRVRCWGGNEGQALFPTGEEIILVPRTVEGLSAIAELAMGQDAQCARTLDGQIQCWGINNRNQVGDGSGRDTSAPVPLLELAVTSDLDGGGYGFCAVRNFVPQCWGRYFGPRPTQVDGFPSDGVVEVSPGAGLITGTTGSEEVHVLPHVCARTPDGQVFCWGGNAAGQLGDGTISEERKTPAPVLW
ncbi:MAG: hypothetical protein IT384_06190 [Deltaproteobacteria bacterium]|nr:hypothetical protein [Deltaproteobacteria bacterium]